MKTPSFNLVYVCLFFCLLSCSEKEDAVTPATIKTRADMMVGNWMFQSLAADLGGGKVVTIYSRGETKNLLDMPGHRLKIGSNGDYSQSDYYGNNFKSGKWQLINNETQLKLTEASGEITTLNIESLSGARTTLIKPNDITKPQGPDFSIASGLGLDYSKGLSMIATYIPATN